jgi:ssDNA-binding Zn-finger/Zn-ribbon topoisomerase 1
MADRATREMGKFLGWVKYPDCKGKEAIPKDKKAEM